MQMPTITAHDQAFEPASERDEPPGNRDSLLELRPSLDLLRAQALWLDMPEVAHFIEVAVLTISESANQSRADAA